MLHEEVGSKSLLSVMQAAFLPKCLCKYSHWQLLLCTLRRVRLVQTGSGKLLALQALDRSYSPMCSIEQCRLCRVMTAPSRMRGWTI